MNKLFIDDLISMLENDFTIQKTDQKGVKETLIQMDMVNNFPMVCYEHTDDSNFEESIDESKFLNDSIHSGTWIIGKNDDEVIFVLNINAYGNRLDIDTLEINSDYRGEGLGGNIVSVIESVAEHYYDEISTSPYDTNASNFWNYMDYLEWRDGNLVKPLNVE